MTALDPERRSRLLATKLEVLARGLGVEGRSGLGRSGLGRSGLGRSGLGQPATFPGGAALVAGDRAVVLGDDAPARSLGPALAWARQAGASTLDLLVEDAAGLLARRATAFAVPPTVWWVQGRDLHPVEAEPLAGSPPVSPEAVDLAPAIVAAGADVVVEHGVVIGEVLGLEIARVVVDGGARIEAGVGRHDREAFAMLHGDMPQADALAAVVGAARGARSAAGPDHPLKRLAQERWLREIVLADPSIVGAGFLERHEGPLPRPGVKEPWPAVAVGDGVVAVCSVGIDLDLVPFASDARLAADPQARLVLVVPERDAHPVTRALAASLREPAEVVAIPGDWRSR